MKKIFSILLSLSTLVFAQNPLDPFDGDDWLWKITAIGPLSAYSITFEELVKKNIDSTDYYVTITDYQGGKSSPILITLSNVQYDGNRLVSCTGSMASVSFDPYDNSALYGAVWGIDVNTTQIMNFVVEESPRFVLNATSQASGTITWSGAATFDYRYSGETGVTEDVEIEISRVDQVVLIEKYKLIPEPATATLGLLALCGLAARRRRR